MIIGLDYNKNTIYSFRNLLLYQNSPCFLLSNREITLRNKDFQFKIVSWHFKIKLNKKCANTYECILFLRFDATHTSFRIRRRFYINLISHFIFILVLVFITIFDRRLSIQNMGWYFKIELNKIYTNAYNQIIPVKMHIIPQAWCYAHLF